MTGHEELVKALRLCQFGECGCGKCYYKELKGDWCTEDNHPEFFDCDDKLKLDAAAAIEELQAQLMYATDAAKEIAEKVPKRGKWYTELFDGDKKYQCSNCLTHWDVETRYCPFCGAKMEAQE